MVLGLAGPPARRRQSGREGRPAGRRHGCRQRRRRPPRPGQLPGVGHREVVRVQRGQPHQPAPGRVRGGGRCHRHRRRGDAAPFVPGGAGPIRHAGVGAGAQPRPRGQRRQDGRAGGRPAGSSTVPRGHDDDRARLRPGGAADPRIGRATRSSSIASWAGRLRSPAPRGSIPPSSATCASAAR